MTAHDPDHDFHQFRHFDRPVSPSPSAAASLHRRLNLTAVDVETVPISATKPAMSSPATAPTSRAIPKPSPSITRTWQVAAAILAAIVLVSSLAIMQQSGEPLRLAFQPDTSTNVDVNPAGTAGRTWQVGDQNPIVGSPVWSRFSHTTMDLRGTVVVDGSVIVDMFPTEGQERTLARLDLETGEIYWQSNLVVTGIHAADDTHLFGFWVPNLDKPQETQLIAIDLGTGDVAWRGPTLADRSFGSSATAVVDGDTVYALDFLGNLVSVDAATGVQNWQFPEQFRTPTGGEDGVRGGIFLIPQLALSQDSVFIVRPSQSIAKFNRITGQEVGVIDVIDDYASMTRQVEVAVSESFLLVMALAPSEVTESYNVSHWEVPTELLVFDRNTLDLVGRTSIPDLRGTVAIQGDSAFVPMSDGDPSSRIDQSRNPSTRVDAIDLKSVTVTSQITGFEGGRQVLLSLAGDTLIVTSGSGDIGFYDPVTLHLIDSMTIDLPRSEFTFQSPVLMDGATPIVVGSIGEIYLLNGPSLPATPLAATPTTG